MNILENYLKSVKVQKTLNTRPGDEGFSLVELVVVIAVLAILSAVAIPAFVGVQANARASAVKNGLVNGVKECVVLDADNKDTFFADAQSFADPDAFRGFEIKKTQVDDPTSDDEEDTLPLDNCFNALAESKTSQNADFTISMNPATGVVTRTCSDEDMAGCESDGNDDAQGKW